MAKEPDDLEAVRKIVDTLKSFKSLEDQERILRWAREKLGMAVSGLLQAAPGVRPVPARAPGGAPQPAPRDLRSPNIREFVSSKRPASDIQFAATIAYFFRFETQEDQRKEAITAADLQESTRLVQRARFKSPLSTLNNAVKQGLLDRGADPGTFQINTVGENLVAMALPSADRNASPPRIPRKKKKKKKAPKEVHKKRPQKKAASGRK